MKTNPLRNLLIFPFLLCGHLNAEDHMGMKVLDVRKIWDAAPHNAFTDLERFNGRWYCAFREGKGHAGGGDYGKLRVIDSEDGKDWKSAALLETKGVDLRDAKLSITPGGMLLLNSCEYRVDNDKADIRNNTSVTYISSNGTDWKGPTQIADKGYWLWQTTWQSGTGYAVGYRWGNRDATKLYQTKNGSEYTPLVNHLRPPGDRSNEHAMFFDDKGRAYMLLRRDNATSKQAGLALLGQANAPYTDWEWRRLNVTIGGPSMIQLPDGRIIACVRRYAAENHRDWGSQWTEIGWINPATATYTPATKLPSSGDSSYAGLVWHKGLLWISYYSSHEGKTSIYLAKVSIPGVKEHSIPVDIASRRELFVDDHLIGQLNGAALRLHHPVRSANAFNLDKPWEGIFSGYPTVIKHKENYFIYYRGMPRDSHNFDTEVTCVATSKDGIQWQRPKLSLFPLKDHPVNNVIMARSNGCHNFAPFIDKKPGSPENERFKALGGDDKSGLFCFVSADGIKWSLRQKEPVFRDSFPNGWAFDSQNVCFWSEIESCYVLYYRRFIDGLRTIYRVTSPDLIDWTEPKNTEANLPGEHLYTNQTHPYYRAPHIYIAFPKRFFPGKVSIDPEIAAKLVDNPGYRRDTADAVLMTSRATLHYDRLFREGFIRPGPSPRDWISRSNAPGCGVVPALSPREMYLYRLSHYGQKTTHMTRYTSRVDGFASLSAGADGGEALTRLIRFEGSKLEVNFATSAGGSIRVEIQDATGEPIPGFSLDKCRELVGDQISRVVAWGDDSRLAKLVGESVRLRFALNDADLYSYCFQSSP